MVDLRATVTHVLDTTNLTSPKEIATKVNGMLDETDRESALEQCLVPFVREFIGKHRRDNAFLVPSSTTPAVGRSAKREAISAAYQSALRERYHVGDNRWVMLGDCTHADLLFMAAERRDQARRNAAEADRWEALADRLNAHGVERVADLPHEARDDLE